MLHKSVSIYCKVIKHKELIMASNWTARHGEKILSMLFIIYVSLQWQMLNTVIYYY
jgi:hypothetical protein